MNLNPQSHITTFKRDVYTNVKENEKESSILFHSYYGFGDQIHMRPFVVRALNTYQNVYIVTPYPDILYHGTKVKCLPPETKLKNQKEWTEKNKKTDIYSEPLSKYTKTVRFDYGSYIRIKNQPILQSFNEQFPICKNSDLGKIDMSFPIKKEWIDNALLKIGDIKNKKLCVLKLPSKREEWKNYNRNALMKYFQKSIDLLKDHFYFVSVADLRENKEWLAEECPTGIDLKLHNAELQISEIIGLCSIADLVITTPSFMTCLCALNNYKCFNIFGGYAESKTYHAPLNPSNYGFIEPDAGKFTFTNDEVDNKEINETRFVETLSDFVEYLHPDIDLRKGQRKLLICRMGHEIAGKIKKTVGKTFDIVTVCHTNPEDYKTAGIEEAYHFNNSIPESCYQQTKEIIRKHKITHAIIGQKGNGQSDACLRACVEDRIKVFFGERFFDNRIIIDMQGLQYQPVNDIEYAQKHYKTNIILPKQNREIQPDDISKDELLQKYNVTVEKTVVILAQLPYDEAIKACVSPFIETYDDFLNSLIIRNANTTFLIKYHPQEDIVKKHIRYENKYKNVKVCNESLNSLFDTFDYFASFSSTCIFEGLLKSKKFITGGFHLCRDSRLVLEVSRPEWMSNVIDKLKRFNINKEYADRHLSFITTKYTVDITKKELLKKLLGRQKFYNT